MTNNDPHGVRKQSGAVATMAEHWPLIDSLLGGTTAMRKAGKTYLPQWPNEAPDAYAARLATATLFSAFARTVEVMTGKPFSKPLTLSDDIPAPIKEMLADVDLEGRNLHAFAASLCGEALSHGLSGILVDFPPTQDVRTKAEEKSLGLRPYFVQIHPRNLLGWKAKRQNGAEVLTQLRFLESVTVDDGAFGEAVIEQVRVLVPGGWQTWRETKNAAGEKEWAKFDEGKTTLDFIPFVPVYGNRKGFMKASPPLAELAHMNVEHWQSKSDQQTILHVARVPILFGKMLGNTAITVGASNAVLCDDPNGELAFVEHSGKAIESGRLSLLDLEDRMRQVGAELLVIKPGNITETQTVADNEPAMCALQRISQDLEDAIDTALGYMAQWIRIPPAGHVSIYRDFGAATLAEASAELLRGMNVDGTVSDETLFNEMQRRGILSQDLKWNEELIRIRAQPPKDGAKKLQD